MAVTHFGRSVVESLKPKRNGQGLPGWVIILLVIVVIGLLVMMLLKSGGGGALGGAVKTAASSLPSSGSPITPAG